MTAQGKPGPRRPQTLSAAELDRLVAEARALGDEVSRHQAAMRTAAAHRKAAVTRAYAAGISVRDLAAHLGISPSTVQTILRSKQP